MKNTYLILIFIFMNHSAQIWKNTPSPKAQQINHIRNIHKDKVIDPYYWMIDYFKKGPHSEKIVDYLKEENTYWETQMQDTQAFQKELFQELKARIKEKDESLPTFVNGYFYYSKTEEGKQYFKYFRKKGNLNAPEELLLDVDQLAEGKSYYSVAGLSVSPNNEWLVYSVDDVSRRQYQLYLKNLKTGKTLFTGVKNTAGVSVWANDNLHFFYTENNTTTLLSEKIKRHKINTDASKDVVVYHEKDPSNYIGVGKSKNNAYLFISSTSTTSNEHRILSADEPLGEFKIFQNRMKNVLYDIVCLDDKFLIITNQNALNFKLMETPLQKTTFENWKEIIPHRKDVLLEDVEDFKNYLIISERENGLSQLQIIDRKTNTKKSLKFDDPSYSLFALSNPEYDTEYFRFGYTSLVQPTTQYEQNLKTGERKLLKQQEVLGNYNKEEYTSERLFATAKDGAKIPISLVYKKGLQKNGKNPLLLYAYGSYGASMDASFSSTRLSLLDRGFVFAIAHIRGGQEMGRHWYEEGKLMKKMNTFTDFIDCGEYLINEKITSPQHLYAQGGSAGGLLMGVVANLKPELWNGMIAQVPFVDVVNTMLDESIPLTTNEYEEWGNPNQKEAYDYMKSYSPYENIEKKNYPNLLVTTGLHDSQVQYFEPAKWVAKLRDTKTGNQIILLKTDMDYGHGGASGRFDYLKDIAFNYCFLFKLEGIKK